MTSVRLALFCSLLLAPVGLAQTKVVVPAGLDKVEGSTYSYTPAGRAPSRTQFIYGSQVLPSGQHLVRSLRMRRDGLYSTTFKKHTFETAVWMANNPRDPADGYSSLYAGNRGPDHAMVVSKRLVDYPTSAKPASAPAPFSISFTLDKPFTYGGKALLVEFEVFANSYTTDIWYPDAHGYAWGGAPSGGKREYSGSGCPAKFYNYGDKPHVGQALTHYGYSRLDKVKRPALDMIGASAASFGGLTLPYDLAGLGAPGCHLYTAILATQVGATSATSSAGYVLFDWGCIPNDPTLVGAVYYEQQAVADATFNALGLRLSRLAKCTLGRGLAGTVECLQISGYGSTFTMDTLAATKVTAAGLVLELGL